MISSISSASSSMAMMRSGAAQRQPPPPDKDVFKVADSDSNGLVSSTELKTLAAGIEKITGNSINVEDALSSYDADQDGSLNGEELQGLMASQGFPTPGLFAGEDGEDGMRPPPPPKPDQALSAYAQNSGEDSISQLIAILQGQTESSTAYSALKVTA